MENRGCVVSICLFQLHLFECTKEEDVKKTLKNHIYFVSTSIVQSHLLQVQNTYVTFSKRVKKSSIFVNKVFCII